MLLRRAQDASQTVVGEPVQTELQGFAGREGRAQARRGGIFLRRGRVGAGDYFRAETTGGEAEEGEEEEGGKPGQGENAGPSPGISLGVE